MNKFDKCKACHKVKECMYLARGENCYEKLNVIAYESKCDCVQGKSLELNINQDDCDIRLDLILDEVKGIKIWGQVTNSYKVEVEGALVTLFKRSLNEKLEYIPIATTLTDYKGFYQFYIDKYEEGDKYKLSANKY